MRRAVLLALTVLAIYVGGWAYFATESWYRSFPGFGLSWLPVLGPRNDHLASDVGAFYLALAALSAVAARWSGDTRLVRAAGLTWLVFSVPHLIYHLRHLDMYGTRDQVLNVIALVLFVVAGAVLTFARDRGGVRGGGEPGR